jgi:MFS family permease
MMRKTAPRSPNQKRGVLALSMLLGASAMTMFVPAAQADEVSPTGKGIVGGALLGGEVVTITESLARVHPGWAYALGGGLGAVGGGIGGFFVEQNSSDGKAPVYLLAGGMALIIPALVLSLNATRYQPSESATEDKPPPGLAPANPGVPGGSAVMGPDPAPAATPPPPPPASPGPPLSLLDVNVPSRRGGRSGFRLGVPLPEVRQMYSTLEQKTYGLPQRSEVRMPVFNLTF